jgi:benzoyl-CoA reductase/2-hydroxyglutaryl-CoA dehydratase subunit BcrC/BadD/HgdB
VKYNTEELRRFVRFLEEQTGKKMDWDRLSEIVDLTDKIWGLFYEIGQLRKAVPCPMGAEDHMTTMVPCQFMMARKGVYEFYKDLYAEVKYKVDNKIGIVPEEKYRLLMEGGPPWYALNTYDYFKKYGAVFAVERVYNFQLPIELLDIPKVSDPLEHIAWRKFKFTVHWHDAARRLGCCPDVARWIEQIDDYKIDGIVQFRNYSCRAFNLSTFTYLDILKRYRDIPSLLIEGDLADINFYSEADTHSRIDTFIEILNQSKRGK